MVFLCSSKHWTVSFNSVKLIIFSVNHLVNSQKLQNILFTITTKWLKLYILTLKELELMFSIYVKDINS